MPNAANFLSARRISSLSLHLPARLDRIRHQHRDRHWTYSARDWRDGGCFWRDFIERNIANQAIAAFGFRIVDPIDSDVDYCSAIANVLGFDESRLTHRGDHDIGRPRNFGEPFASGMNYRHGRIAATSFFHQ